MESVHAVLDEIGCAGKPTLPVLNKIDAIKDISALEMLETVYPNAVSISARGGRGLDALARKIMQFYRGGDIVLRVSSRPADGRIHSFLRKHGQILAEQYGEDAVVIEVRMGRNQLPELQRLKPHAVETVGH
jgi:GTP-binding protein HflX